jgi:hypothetical protein
VFDNEPKLAGAREHAAPLRSAVAQPFARFIAATSKLRSGLSGFADLWF